MRIQASYAFHFSTVKLCLNYIVFLKHLASHPSSFFQLTQPCVLKFKYAVRTAGPEPRPHQTRWYHHTVWETRAEHRRERFKNSTEERSSMLSCTESLRRAYTPMQPKWPAVGPASTGLTSYPKLPHFSPSHCNSIITREMREVGLLLYEAWSVCGILM